MQEQERHRHRPGGRPRRTADDLGPGQEIYGGYEAYARRITGREIPIMVLSG
jgi:hypothetical protein